MQSNALNSFSLQGKRAIVTGAAQGIGRAIAIAYAQAGAEVGCLDISMEGAQRTVDEIKAFGGQGLALGASVASEDQTRAAVKEFTNSNPAVHILVNGAAASDPSGTVVEYSLEHWNNAIAVNLTGTFLMSKAVIPFIERTGGGSVIHIASQLGRVGSARRAVYCAIKGGLLNLARAMAIDHAPQKIRVNTLSPGAIETERMLLRFKTMQDARDQLGPMHLLNRLGLPVEVASAAIYLGSDASSFMTGADLLLDGGYSAS